MAHQSLSSQGAGIGFLGGQFCLKEHIGLAFNHCQNGTLLSFADYQIHISVAETGSVGLGRTFKNRYMVGDESEAGSFALSNFMMTVFYGGSVSSVRLIHRRVFPDICIRD